MADQKIYDLILPKMGESVDEATIVNWLKNVGDLIKVDDFVVEIATDKVDSEVPSDVNGKIIELCHKVNDVVKVGETICRIELNESSDNNQQPDLIDEIPNIELISEENKNEELSSNEISKPLKVENQKYISPLVRSIALKEKISEDELLKISGSGKDGRITKNDILKHIKLSNNFEFNKNSNLKSSLEDKSTIRDLTRMEKILAAHMVNSRKISPHVQSFIELDVTSLWVWRNSIKDEFLKKENNKLTITHVFIKVVAEVLREFPILNSSLKDD